MIGVVSDGILLLLAGDTENLVVAVLAGIFGHLGKFLIKWLFGIVSGAPIGFVALGLLRAILSYILLGAQYAVLGLLTLKVLKRAGFFAYLAEKR